VACQLNAIHGRHANIGQNHINGLPTQRIKGIDTVASLADYLVGQLEGNIR